MWKALLLLIAALATADLGPAPSPGLPQSFVVELPDGGRVLGLGESVASSGPDRWVWRGHVLGEPESSLVVSGVDGALRGVLRSSRGEYEISAGVPPVVRASLMGAPVQEDRAPLVPGPAESAGPGAVSGGGGPIDLLVVYTPRARAAAGSAREMEALVQLGVAEANLAFERSRVAARVRLVELRELDYLESGRVESDLEILRSPGDGALDEVQEIREAFGADLVQLVVAEDDGCGIAYLLPGAATSYGEWAFSVVEWSCIETGLALAHEIGHSLGCDHAPEDATSGGAFDFSFGYRDPLNRFRTVMAYGPAPRVARFSSARARLAGLATGAPLQDNALTIERVSRGVAAFRPAIEPPRLVPGADSTISGGVAELRIVSSSRRDVAYWVIAGRAPGGRDLFDSGPLTTPDRVRMSGLPTDGGAVFVRVFYRPGHVWLHEDFRYLTDS